MTEQKIQPGDIPFEIQAQIVRDATAAATSAVTLTNPSAVACQIAEAGVLAWQITEGRATESSNA